MAYGGARVAIKIALRIDKCFQEVKAWVEAKGILALQLEKLPEKTMNTGIGILKAMHFQMFSDLECS